MPRQHELSNAVRRLDPIDGDRLADRWSTSDAKRTLFAEITATPVPSASPTRVGVATRIRSRRNFAFASVFTIALAAGLVVSSLWPGTRTPAYAVRQLSNGMLQVAWDGDLDGDRLAATLREHGVDVRVETQPSSPSQVGRVIGLGPLQEQGDAVFQWSKDGTSTFTLDPSAFRGTFHILIQRAAKPGEKYASGADVFTPGEVLGGIQCVTEGPLRAEDVAPHLDRLGQSAVWDVLNGGTHKRGVPNGEVLWGFATDPDTVRLTVRLDGDASSADRSPLLDGADCTEDLAAAWR